MTLFFSILDLLHWDIKKLSNYSLKFYNYISKEMYSSYYFFSPLIPNKTYLQQPGYSDIWINGYTTILFANV